MKSLKSCPKSIFILGFFPFVILGSLFIDHFEIETNETLATVNLTYKHNNRNNCIINVSIQNNFPAQKGLIYIKVNVAENKDDNEYKRELVRTRIDFEKLLRGLHGNFLVKTFMKNVREQIVSLNLSVPIRPVS